MTNTVDKSWANPSAKARLESHVVSHGPHLICRTTVFHQAQLQAELDGAEKEMA